MKKAIIAAVFCCLMPVQEVRAAWTGRIQRLIPKGLMAAGISAAAIQFIQSERPKAIPIELNSFKAANNNSPSLVANPSLWSNMVSFLGRNWGFSNFSTMAHASESIMAQINRLYFESDIRAIVRNALDKDALIQEAADNYLKLLKTRVGCVFLDELYKNSNEFAEKLEGVTLNYLTEEVLVRPIGAPLSQHAKDLLACVHIGWIKLSASPACSDYKEHYAQCYFYVLASLCAQPEQLNNVRFDNIKDMLLYAPEHLQKDYIMLLLRYFDAKQCVALVRHNFVDITQLIADIILLYDKDIDVPSVAADQSFADAVLQAMQDLRESYNYHLKYPKDTSALYSWVSQELCDERGRVYAQIEDEWCATGLADVLLQCAERSIAEERLREEINDKAEKYVIQEYIRRKLRAMGFDFPHEIRINTNLSLTMRVRYPGGKTFLSLGHFNRVSALGLNAMLAHEMVHYYENHGYFGGAVEFNARAENKKPKSIFSKRIVEEKQADIDACFKTGPQACSELADFVAYVAAQNSSKKKEGDPHLDGARRKDALINLAQLIGKEDSGEPFVRPRVEESPFAQWLYAKGEHPK